MKLSLINKALKRIIRKITFHKSIYGNVGHSNIYCKDVFIHEMSSVGNYNYFGKGTMVTNAIIGNYCSIAPGVKIAQAEHSISYITTYNRISKKNINYNMFTKKTHIGNDVWIGGNAIILQGVTIGNGAVIGAGAVVNKDIPDYAIAVGIPARVIKYRFDNEKIEKLLHSEWWKYDIRQATEKIKDLENDIL